MTNHPDTHFKQTLFDIIQYRAKIGYTSPDQFILSKNLVLVDKAPDIITKDLEHQISKDQVTKVESLPFKFIVSPLGLVLKPNNSWQCIYYFSHSEGRSVNDYILEEWGAIEYVIVDEVIRKIRYLGQGCTLIKQDLAKAF